ncbi:MAG: peroxide stress protein YaaA [Bacteroidales bacterium]|nr:peroxide stress protein YaaA [Bacteroidales bacterium]
MLTLLSPSKTLNEKPRLITDRFTIPEFIEKSAELIEILKGFSPSKLGKLMEINPKLSNLNVERYLRWRLPFDSSNSQRAILMFKGEVYNGLKAETLTEKNLHFAQDHLRILSGLYGILKPLDLMQAYRLEMGTQLKNSRGSDLYKFWRDLLTEKINEEISSHKEKVILNLASDEYFTALDTSMIKARVLKCMFKEERDGELKFITIFGKKARGMMTRFIIENKIDSVKDLKAFDSEGYHFNHQYSSDDLWMFSR